MQTKKITAEYIRGFIEGVGTFTFTTSSRGFNKKVKIPTFQLRMNIRDKRLIELIRGHLGLKNRVYVYHYPGTDGAKRGPQVMLIVREIGNLKNIIIPFFYDKLVGYKAAQFNKWLESIGKDSEVPEGFKILYRLHKSGWFSKK
ncbi:MAG: LAGLIDADG family homing endonuclease [Patescibacteria group bacterium]